IKQSLQRYHLMTIILPLSSLLEILFPHIKDYNNIGKEELSQIKELYSFGSCQPKEKLTEINLDINFDDDLLQKNNDDFQELSRLSENRAYDQALAKVNRLLEEKPAVSDYHRIKGQILSEQGQPEEAIDDLIEAVRLDPDNSSALIMLGNIYAKDRSDADTALSFYERVLETNPD